VKRFAVLLVLWVIAVLFVLSQSQLLSRWIL
jgi:hypothetical protein